MTFQVTGVPRWVTPRWRDRIADPHAVLIRQLAILTVFLLSLLFLLSPTVTLSSPPLVWLAVGLVLAASVIAAIIPLDDPARWLLIAIPFTDLIAGAILRGVTGAGSSIYSSLLVLPVLSLGAEFGLLPILVTAIGLTGAVGVPLLQGERAADWLRILTTPVVLTMTAAAVSVLTSRLRSRIEVVQQLRSEQERLLVESRAQASLALAGSALLHESNELMASVIDAVTEQFIISTDNNGRIEVFNPGAQLILGILEDDALGGDVVSVLGDGLRRHGDLPRYISSGQTLTELGTEGLFAAARSGRPRVDQWTYDRVGGSVIVVELAVTARRGMDGDVNGFLLVGTDNTAAHEQARLKDEFVSLISHELRTPLSSIVGYLELIEDDDVNPLSGEQLEYLAIVQHNAQRLLRLVGDLLFTATVEAGSFSVNNQRVDVTEIARHAVDVALPAAASAFVELELDVATEPLWVLGDPVRLGQACDNLLSNAIKFSPVDGLIQVRAALHDSEPLVLLSVSDTGMGIAEAELDRLFERFFRASNATGGAVPGVGLGLSITRAIALAHAGSIDVRSTLGKGTTFTLSLPALGSGLAIGE